MMMRKSDIQLSVIVIFSITMSVHEMAQASETELAVSNIALAQELTNPVADIMTIPTAFSLNNFGDRPRLSCEQIKSQLKTRWLFLC